MLPIRIMPFVYTALISGALVGLAWLVDEIGDRREAKVWLKIDAAIAATNEDIGKDNELADRVAAVAERARVKTLDEARRTLAGKCPLSADEAQALARIQ